jgi:hypothetical protein
MGVGMFASMLGVGVTNALMGVRQMLDPSFVPLNPPQDMLIMSAAYGTYMASSSNLRWVLGGVCGTPPAEFGWKDALSSGPVSSILLQAGH